MTEQDLLKSVVDRSVIDRRWIALMDYEIQQGRRLYAKAEQGLSKLQQYVRWPIWLALVLYRRDLKIIERSYYRVLGTRDHKAGDRVKRLIDSDRLLT